MMNDLSLLLGWTQDLLFQGGLVFLRLAPIVAFMPGFGETVVPGRVKLCLALCMTLAVLPLTFVNGDPVFQVANPIEVLLQETVIGLFLGLALRFFVITLQVAGSIAAQSTSLAQIFAGASAEPMPAIGHLLVLSGLAFAMIMGLPVHVIDLVYQTYAAIPVGGAFDVSLMVEWAGSLVARSFELAFSVAAPFVAMSLLYNFALGVINRAMPQLMVAFVGAPVITAGGIVFLLLFAPLMLLVWWAAFEAFLLNPGLGGL